jgi:hypothetical protein
MAWLAMVATKMPNTMGHGLRETWRPKARATGFVTHLRERNNPSRDEKLP